MQGVQFIREIGIENIRNREGYLSQKLLEGLKTIDGVVIHSPELQQERTSTVAFSITKMDSSLVAHRLDKEFDIACRAGLHCAPWAHQCLGTLKTGAIRFSPGYFNTMDEIVQVLNAVEQIAQGDEK